MARQSRRTTRPFRRLPLCRPRLRAKGEANPPAVSPYPLRSSHRTPPSRQQRPPVSFHFRMKRKLRSRRMSKAARPHTTHDTGAVRRTDHRQTSRLTEGPPMRCRRADSTATPSMRHFQDAIRTNCAFVRSSSQGCRLNRNPAPAARIRRCRKARTQIRLRSSAVQSSFHADRN